MRTCFLILLASLVVAGNVFAQQAPPPFTKHCAGLKRCVDGAPKPGEKGCDDDLDCAGQCVDATCSLDYSGPDTYSCFDDGYCKKFCDSRNGVCSYGIFYGTPCTRSAECVAKR